MSLSREQLIELVTKIMNTEGTEEEIDEMFQQLRRNVIHPGIGNLIFWDERGLSAEEIVDEALAYKPIILP
jgi:hypothetical protein